MSEAPKPSKGDAGPDDSAVDGKESTDFVTPPVPSRRQFLSADFGQSVTDDETLDVQLPETVQLDDDRLKQCSYVEEYSHRAMACEWSVIFNMHQYKQGAEGALKAFTKVDQLEELLTVFREHSELSRVNRTAASERVELGSELADVLELGLSIFEQTRGAFDFTAAPLTKLWGFDRRQPRMPTENEIAETLKLVGSEQVSLNKTSVGNSTIKFGSDSLAINLGGIGKGFAIDRAAESLLHEEVNDFVIHGGQSSVRACGHRATLDGGKNGWTVGLSHPTLPDVRLGEIFLRNEALGTSGTARQGFFHQGKRYGHIIDPRTGWPPSSFLSTTVISSSAAVSDSLATAFFVMNREEIAEYCERHPGVKTILVWDAKEYRGEAGERCKAGVVIEVFNLKDELDWRRLV